jgi:NAD dependent epimerase/dehydratase family enzyme
MRILVSGASGMIGTELRRQLEADGHDIVKLVRRERRASDEVRWFPTAHVVDPALIASADAIINLSGASTGRLPWTPGYKREILRSRVDATR